MNERIYRSIETSIREGLSRDERWNGDDKGLIYCWENGREKATRVPELAERAKNGELPVTGWKGGVETKTKIGQKYGTFFYLAQWQGLKGDDLNIDLSKEQIITCTGTGMRIVFTDDVRKYGQS
jgi:hypothetical protein